jgi:putative FmdB family regulatory protein
MGCQERSKLPISVVIDPRYRGALALSAVARPGEVTMPQYEFLCLTCKKKFSVILTVAEYEKGEIACPKCGSKKVEQQWAAFFAVTGKKS